MSESHQSFALARGQAERLDVTWKNDFEHLTLQLDGEWIATVATKKQLKDGQSFPLPDGSELKVRLRRDYFGAALEIARDSRPLPGSSGELKPRHQMAYRILYLLAGIHLGGGFVLLGMSAAERGRLYPGWVLFSGILYLVFGLLAHRRSAPALIAGILVYAGDGARSLVGAWMAEEAFPGVGLAMHIVLLVGMIRGVDSTRLLPPKQRSVPPWVEPSSRG